MCIFKKKKTGSEKLNNMLKITRLRGWGLSSNDISDSKYPLLFVAVVVSEMIQFAFKLKG